MTVITFNNKQRHYFCNICKLYSLISKKKKKKKKRKKKEKKKKKKIFKTTLNNLVSAWIIVDLAQAYIEHIKLPSLPLKADNDNGEHALDYDLVEKHNT